MSHRARLLLSAAAATAALASSVPAAHAASVTSPNVCHAANDSSYGDLPLKLDATASVSGGELSVSRIQPSITPPGWMQTQLTAIGYIVSSGQAGTYDLGVDTWMAVDGNGSGDPTSVLLSSGTLRLKVVAGLIPVVTGTFNLGSFPSTSWTAPSGSTVNVAQAPAGALGTIPGGKDDADVKPDGTFWMRISSSSLPAPLMLDCQPGTTGGSSGTTSSTFSVGAAPTFASTLAESVGTPTPSTPGTGGSTGGSTPSGGSSGGSSSGTPAVLDPKLVAGDSLVVSSTALKFGKKGVLVSLACPPGAAKCSGSVVIKSAKKLRTTKRGKKKIRKLAVGRFSVEAGSNGPVKLKLTKDGRRLRKQKLSVKVTVRQASGSVTKRLRANR